MVQKDQVFKQALKKRGIWNFNELYHFCYDWFQKEDYILMEQQYTEKMQDAGKELILKWSSYRKITDYFKFVIDVDWHILGMNPIEVERDGKKIKSNKGEVKITVKGILVKDYESRWEDKPLWKFLRGIYDNYIIRTTVDDFEDRIIEKAVEFFDDVKAYLELSTGG